LRGDRRQDEASGARLSDARRQAAMPGAELTPCARIDAVITRLTAVQVI